MNLTYQAKTPDEFKALSLWLRDNGFTKGAVVASEANNKGPREMEYLSKMGEKRMRLTNEEQGLMAQGKTREDIAAMRLGICLNGESDPASEDDPLT